MTSRSSTAAPILAVLAIVLVMLGAYVGGYFWLGRHICVLTPSWSVGDIPKVRHTRIYRHELQATVFKPAAQIESFLSGRKMNVQASGVR